MKSILWNLSYQLYTMMQAQYQYFHSLEMRLGYVGPDLTQYVFDRCHRLESHAITSLKPRTARTIVVNQDPSLLTH